MSQGAVVLPTTGTVSGLTMTQDTNAALAALVTLNSGASAPTTSSTGLSSLSGILWHDTGNNLLKVRDQADTTWMVIAAFDETNKIWNPPVGGGQSTLASASTTDLWSVNQAFVKVTGTTAITSLCGASDSVVGTMKLVTFAGALTLTYNATSLILPTAADITTAAGDCMIAVSLGSGNVQVLGYWPASGKPLAGAPIVSVKRQTFTASGTYTPSAGMLYCDIEVWGGGGGGGGVGTVSHTAGGGGGSGGYAKKLASASAIGSSQTVTIGAAGTAGSNSGGTGGAGGSTSVGTLCTASGGSGGAGNTNTGANAAGGAGGVGGAGDILASGNGGGAGFPDITITISIPGAGGSTSLGGAGAQLAVTTSTAGNPAVANSGSGGSGAVGYGTGEIGGTGGSGFVVITEYCSQ